MNGKDGECWLSIAGIAAGDNNEKKAKANLQKQQAVQKTVAFIWNTLHALDQSHVRKAMEDDDLKSMWTLLHLRPTQETLDHDVEA